KRDDWIDLYSSCYFIGGPSCINLNQSSEYVENELIKILEDKNHPYTRKDLIKILAWKINEIDHNKSREKIECIKKFDITLQSSRFHRTNYAKAVDYILQYINKNNNIEKCTIK